MATPRRDFGNSPNPRVCPCEAVSIRPSFSLIFYIVEHKYLNFCVTSFITKKHTDTFVQFLAEGKKISVQLYTCIIS